MNTTTIANTLDRNFCQPNTRYMAINNVALDGFFIGSGKTTTLNRVFSKLLEWGWINLGRLRGSNFRLLQKKGDTSHYCLLCDDLLATCSLPDNINLMVADKIFKGNNIQNFLNMRSPNINQLINIHFSRPRSIHKMF